MSEFLPHYYTTVAKDAQPRRWLLALHGIIGRAANWRTFARNLTEARPDWGVVTVDLRMHGRSQGAPAPHSVEACAADLVRLESTLGVSIDGISGHSFGSKVATLYATQRREVQPLEAVWILDADPGARPDRLDAATQGQETVFQILASLEALPKELASRDEFHRHLAADGYAQGLVQWLGMNLSHTRGHYELQLDIPALRTLLQDYLRLDLWEELRALANTATIDVVLGGNSTAVSAAGQERFQQWDAEGLLALHSLPDAGHWVHVDDLEGLLQIFLRTLP